MDTYKHICSKTRGCCGIKLIFILHIASKTAGIIFKMQSSKGVPLTALTLQLTDPWSNRVHFYSKNEIGEMEKTKCSPKSAMNSLRNNEPLSTHFIPLHTQGMFFITSNMQRTYITLSPAQSHPFPKTFQTKVTYITCT